MGLWDRNLFYVTVLQNVLCFVTYCSSIIYVIICLTLVYVSLASWHNLTSTSEIKKSIIIAIIAGHRKVIHFTKTPT